MKPEGYVDVDLDDMREGTLMYLFEAAGSKKAKIQGNKSMREQSI
jgi:hypothetical protein